MRPCRRCGHDGSDHDGQSEMAFCYRDDCDCPDWLEPLVSFPVELEHELLCSECQRVIKMGQPFTRHPLGMGEYVVSLLTCVYCVPSEESMQIAWRQGQQELGESG